MLPYLGLLLLGLALGAIGTLIGAGGGFLLVPLLLLLYPSESAQVITSISLAVVFLNALSGSVSYARLKRIDYRAGSWFALGSVPGAALGAMTTTIVPRGTFDALLGTVLLGVAAFLWWRPANPEAGENLVADDDGAASGRRRLLAVIGRYKRLAGAVLSALVGYVSTLLGIGGGIIHVPALVHLLRFPVHVATATSHFVLAITAGSGTLTHIVTGAFHHGARRTLALGLGVIAGAPLGAILSSRLHGKAIMRALALAIAAAAVRVLLSSHT